MIGRPLSLYEAAGARMAGRVAEGLTGSWNPSGIASDVSRECVDLLGDLLRVPAASAVEAAAELDAPDTLPASLEVSLEALLNSGFLHSTESPTRSADPG